MGHRVLIIVDWYNVAAFDADGNEIGILFQTATPFETPRKMDELIEWTRRQLAGRTIHPLLAIAMFTVVFLEIHPFQDGNGRLSRILTTLMLLRADYSYVPYSSLESVIENEKEGYYRALRQTQRTIRSPSLDWEPWVLYFLRALRQQKRLLEAKIEREHLIINALPALSIEIVSTVKDRGRVTIAEVVKLTGANRNTVKKHLAALVAAGHISRHGKGKATWYGQG